MKDKGQDITGDIIYKWCKDLFPINRSLTGPGVRETLKYFKNIIPDLEIKSVSSGYKAFDWNVPNEWAVNSAWVKDSKGNIIIDFDNCNLHIVGYSTPFNGNLSLNELQDKIHTLPNMPDTIPYVTSYYSPTWGFCMAHKDFMKLDDDIYEVKIDTNLKKGILNYGELIIPSTLGNSEEVFLSSYICHPSMANNELSGPTVITAIAKWLTELAERKYTYRIVYVPETIGPLVYMSKNLNTMKENIIAGFNITCIGDDRSYSYMTSRNGSTLSDKAAKHVLKHIDTNFKSYQWSQRGSDERQYCSPGADLPIASIMRTKWAEYPEYHTSDDDLGNVVTPDGLFGGFEALKKTLEAIEENCTPIATFIGEPQLGKRGLYPNLSTRVTTNWVPRILEFLTWCDGDHDLFDISEKCKCPIWDLYSLRDRLVSEGLIKLQNTADR